MLQTVSIVVKGKVQGVYYRQSTKEKALKLGISGYVQNLPDGSVFIKVTGTIEQVTELANWCKAGPPAAIVNEVSITEIQNESFEGFSIKRN